MKLQLRRLQQEHHSNCYPGCYLTGIFHVTFNQRIFLFDFHRLPTTKKKHSSKSKTIGAISYDFLQKNPIFTSPTPHVCNPPFVKMMKIINGEKQWSFLLSRHDTNKGDESLPTSVLFACLCGAVQCLNKGQGRL